MKVTNEMIGAAHDICLKKGDFVLSAALLERIYLAMDALANHAETSGSLPNTTAAEQAIQDTLRYGVHATKDGKRIDPTDLYPAAEPILDDREKQHRFSMMQYQDVCKGTNCNASRAMPHHSAECEAEHDACYTHPAAERPDHREVMQRALAALEETAEHYTATPVLEKIINDLRNALKGEV